MTRDTNATVCAIILAAGEGTRLRPLTYDRPKCMVELLGRSILEHQISTFSGSDIRDITVVGGYLADSIDAANITVRLNKNYYKSNMVYTLFCAQDKFYENRDVVVSYGDIVYEARVLKRLIDSDAPISVLIDKNWRSYWQRRMDNPLDDLETLILAVDGTIQELGRIPSTYDQIQGQYIGLFKVNRYFAPKIVDVYKSMDRTVLYDGKDFDNMYMTSFIQHLIDIGYPVQAVEVSAGWLEVDTVSDIELYERMARDGELGQFYQV